MNWSNVEWMNLLRVRHFNMGSETGFSLSKVRSYGHCTRVSMLKLISKCFWCIFEEVKQTSNLTAPWYFKSSPYAIKPPQLQPLDTSGGTIAPSAGHVSLSWTMSTRPLYATVVCTDANRYGFIRKSSFLYASICFDVMWYMINPNDWWVWCWTGNPWQVPCG